MEYIVISLGGSLIIPNKMDIQFLKKFKNTLQNNYRAYKFVVVCGGGTTARKYIAALKAEGMPKTTLSEAGIMATRENAMFMMKLFGKKEANDSLPLNMKEVKNNLSKNNIVFCGALRFTPNATSDTTTAKLAAFLKTPLINLSNVKGLYTKDPKKHKDAKFIRSISWKKFNDMADKIRYKAGQNFILDQNAARIIKKNKIQTYLIGNDLKNLENILNNKPFIGTILKG